MADGSEFHRRRVVVTGIGVLTGDSIGVDPFWLRLIDPGAGPTNSRLIGFDPADFLDRRIRRHTDIFAQVGAAAAVLARADATLETTDPDRTGVVMGSGNAVSSRAVIEYQHFVEEGMTAVDPLLGLFTMTNAPASTIALQQGARGPTHTISSGCASGTHAVGEGARLVQHGECDVVYAGGSEIFYRTGELADAATMLLSSLENLRVTTSDEVARPFDTKRNGFVPADGAACLVLESLEHAKARGARVYCEIVGYGNTNDAFDLVAPEPDGAGIRRCMQVAMREGGLEPSDVGLINTHGTATINNDLAEARAITHIFGTGGPAVNSIKGTTGHSGPAAGAVEIASVVLSVERGMIPPTGGLQELADEFVDLGLDVVQGEARAWTPGAALSLSLGLGGHNGCVAITPYTA